MNNQQKNAPNIKRSGTTGRSPEFVLCDHTRDQFAHYHELFFSSQENVHFQTLQRISRYLGLSELEVLHLRKTTQKVHGMTDAIMYMAKCIFLGPFLIAQKNKIKTWDLNIVGNCLTAIETKKNKKNNQQQKKQINWH
jgi:hypothetical protein